jgi:transposase
MRGNNGKVTFKPYVQNQPMLLPPSLDELVPEGHLVRVVNDAVERMNIDPLLERYKGGGTSSYHPKMMLKALIYAYSQRIYSSRQIAKALRENIHFMWLSGQNRPDFRTINTFRSSTMKGLIDDVFASVLELLIEAGFVKLENYFLDGTKVEANANRYTFVWGKSVAYNKAKLQEKIRLLIEQIEQANEAENAEYGDRDLEEMGGPEPLDPKKLEEKIRELDEKLAGKSKDKTAQKALKTLKEDCLPRSQRYEEQERKLAGRKSYSKTDEDATFMRMKEDHMRNGQLKPGYNVQIGTENQFVVGFSIHQKPGDTTCLIPHLKHVEDVLHRRPENVIADAGYGSEENYEFLNEKQLGNYVKYNTFSQEQKKRFKKDAFQTENWPYDAEQDEFICPAGQRLTYLATRRQRSENGYVSERRIYAAQDCGGCLHRDRCAKGRRNRHLQVSFRLDELKGQACSNLLSERGMKLRAQRQIEPEPVFGRLKNNWGFRRFLLRGLEKVKVEWGLLCIAHNLAKTAAC